MQSVITVVLTIVVLAVLKLGFLLLLSGGDFGRVKLATGCFFKVVRDGEFARKSAELLKPPPPEPPKPVKPSGVPLRFLTLLQREGRLLDFFLEKIDGAPDDLLAAAVRDIHRKCQNALQEHLVLEPVLAGEEESTVEVPAGFDPSAVRLVGNVPDQPPFKGALKHHGWRVKQIKLAPPPEGQDELVVMPAEVDIP